MGAWTISPPERCDRELLYCILPGSFKSLFRAILRSLAGVPGLEPRLTEPESVVLPITPYPNGIQRHLDHPAHQQRDARSADLRVEERRQPDASPTENI